MIDCGCYFTSDCNGSCRETSRSLPTVIIAPNLEMARAEADRLRLKGYVLISGRTEASIRGRAWKENQPFILVEPHRVRDPEHLAASLAAGHAPHWVVRTLAAMAS